MSNADGWLGDQLLGAPDLFHRTVTRKHGRVVVKETGPWAQSVRSLLRHLEAMGYSWSPRLVEDGPESERRDPIADAYVTYAYVSDVTAILGKEPGATAELIDRGEVVGLVVRTKARVKPVYVSVSHRLCLATAARFVLTCSRGYRLPEPQRQAHLAASGQGS